MKLKDYLKTLTPVEREAFAKKCKTSVGYLKQLTCEPADKGDVRRPSTKLSRKFVEHSGGALRLEILRPDIWGQQVA